MTNKEFLESITLEGEEWRDVVGYEGLYVVSNLGEICIAQTFYNYQAWMGSKYSCKVDEANKFTLRTSHYYFV